MSNEFEIKDSGQRESFESGMVRDTQDDKILYSLIFEGPMLGRWAEHLTKGAKKYGPNNWLRASGMAELDRFRESALRHFIQWFYGDLDEDHAAAVFFNINGAEYVRGRLNALATDDLLDLLRSPTVFIGSAEEADEFWRQEAEENIRDLDAPKLSVEITGTAPPPVFTHDELIDRAVAEAAADGFVDEESEKVVRAFVNAGVMEPFISESGQVLFRYVEGQVGDHTCDCDPAVYQLTVVNSDSPLDGRTVYGSYSKCNEVWYAFPPGTDPRKDGMVYDLPNEQVEIGPKVAASLEALLDTP